MALNEDEQTDAVFKSSRTDVDPVSGNDVPPGSLPEEVRDDIPAQLSEGEYVVPADVLRFYGMKFFEDLRKQAKIELAQMDRDGRIGGEPIAVMEISELSPEEMEELDAIGAAVGGYITQQPTQSTQADPYQQQQMMYRQGAPVAVGNAGYAYGGTVQGYAPGGDVEAEPDFTQPTYTTVDLLNQFGPGFSFTDTNNMTEYSTVTLYGPSGDIITLTLPTQQELYDQKIAEGYTTQQVSVTTETTVGQQPDDGGPDDTDTPEAVDYSSLSNEALNEALAQNNTANSIATALMASVPVVGIAAKFAAKHQKSQITEEMSKRGMEVPEEEDENPLSNIIEGIKDFFSKDEAKDQTPTPDKDTTPSYDNNQNKGSVNTSAKDADLGVGATNSNKGSVNTGAKDADLGVGGNSPSGNSPSGNSPSGNSPSGNSSGVAGTNDGEVGEATGGQGDQGKGSGKGGMNQGGMMQKPKNKKKK